MTSQQPTARTQRGSQVEPLKVEVNELPPAPKIVVKRVVRGPAEETRKAPDPKPTVADSSEIVYYHDRQHHPNVSNVPDGRYEVEQGEVIKTNSYAARKGNIDPSFEQRHVDTTNRRFLDSSKWEQSDHDKVIHPVKNSTDDLQLGPKVRLSGKSKSRSQHSRSSSNRKGSKSPTHSPLRAGIAPIRRKTKSKERQPYLSNFKNSPAKPANSDQLQTRYSPRPSSRSPRPVVADHKSSRSPRYVPSNERRVKLLTEESQDADGHQPRESKDSENVLEEYDPSRHVHRHPQKHSTKYVHPSGTGQRFSHRASEKHHHNSSIHDRSLADEQHEQALQLIKPVAAPYIPLHNSSIKSYTQKQVDPVTDNKISAGSGDRKLTNPKSTHSGATANKSPNSSKKLSTSQIQRPPKQTMTERSIKSKMGVSPRGTSNRKPDTSHKGTHSKDTSRNNSAVGASPASQKTPVTKIVYTNNPSTDRRPLQDNSSTITPSHFQVEKNNKNNSPSKYDSALDQANYSIQLHSHRQTLVHEKAPDLHCGHCCGKSKSRSKSGSRMGSKDASMDTYAKRPWRGAAPPGYVYDKDKDECIYPVEYDSKILTETIKARNNIRRDRLIHKLVYKDKDPRPASHKKLSANAAK